MLSFQSALAEPMAPLWEEFAPNDMLYAQMGPQREPLSSALMMGSLLVPGLTLILLPIAVTKSNNAKKDERRNYWASRRKVFDNEIANCEQTTGDKVSCYLQVRQLEAQKTADYTAHLDAQSLKATVSSLRRY